MKKLFFLLVVMVMPFILSAQPMDTTVIFHENFDGSTIKMTTTYIFDDAAGNWKKDSTLQVSAPASYHVRLQPTEGVMACWTRAIPVDRTYSYVYMQFDHICKVSNSDKSYIVYSLSESVDPQGIPTFGSWVIMNNYSATSPYYHGHAEAITDGKVSQNWYGTLWQKTNNAAVPQNDWWRTELFDMTQFVANPNNNNDYFRIRFQTNHTSGAGSGTEACAGWYIDNLKLIYSNVELVPPEITLAQTQYVDNNGQTRNKIFSGTISDFTGPFTVNATLTDNDGIDTTTVLFWYETSEGVVDTLVNTIDWLQSGSNGYTQVKYEWTIPMQCYGTTITYHIFTRDIHGSSCYEERTFDLNTTQTLQVNDAKMDKFVELPVYPDRMVTGQTYPIKAIFRNKGKAEANNPNHMTDAVFGWSVNGVNKPNATWHGDLCLDYTDTILLGDHVALRDSNYIRVWLISRNNVTPLEHRSDDTISYDGYGCDSALSGTYTLGGPTADFPTVRFMKERFYRCGFGGPVTINMNAGTYTGFDFDDQYPGLDSNNTITFQAAPGVNRSAVIIANNGNEPPVKFTEMAYVTIRNVTIRNTQVGRCVEITGRPSHDITIDNCDIQGTSSNSTPYQNSAGIARLTGVTSYTGGTGDKHLTFTNNTISGVNVGVYIAGASGANYREEDVVVSGNTISSKVTGISATYSKRWTIDGNRITQLATTSDMNFVGIALSNCGDFASVSGNSIHMNERGGTGLSFSSYANTNNVTSIMTVANNEIINKAVMTGRYNIMLQNAKQMNLYHNSSYVYSLIDVTQSAPLYVTGSSSNTKEINIYNNIFYNASTSAENKNYAIYLNYSSATGSSSMPSTIKLNNNEYYSVGNSLGWYVAPRNNFAEWQSALSNRGDDSTSISIPLDFVSPTDSLVPSQYEGMECTPISGITTDIRGALRYGTITFMGCYTRAIATTDLALTVLTSPVLSNDCPSNQYPIKLMVKNTGRENLNFATKPATINYTIGTATGTATVTSGTIAPLQSQEVTVVANFPVSINTVYNYSFNIHVNGDNNALNDSLSGSFEIQAAFPYYEEVFSTNELYPSWRFEQVSGAGNWRVELGAGTNPNIAPNYGLGRLFFNSKVFANGTESRAIMPVTILQGATTPILEYWFAHDNVSGTEGVTVKISTDGGTTYSTVQSVNTAGVSTSTVMRRNNAYTTPGWAKYMVDLVDYSDSSCVYIAFFAKSNAKNNMNIDRIVVRNFYDNDLAVNDIWALGVSPTQHEVSPVIYANISNEGRNTQTAFPLMLEITGANTYRDTITVPSLATRNSAVVSFAGVHLTNPGDNLVRIYCATDQNNDNNEHTWQMITSLNEVGYANDSVVGGQHFTYSSLATGGTSTIAYVNKYNMVDTLIATHVKAFITNTANNSNVGRQFRFIVVDASGNLIESSDTMTVTAAMENQWVTGEINNYAITSTNGALYVGIEMFDGGTYLGVQEEAPLRDNAYYKLVNGTLSPSTVGRQMVNAVLESYMPHELALLSVEHPLTDCDLGHESISLKLTNNGSTDLLPGTPIHYSINGGTPVNATITDTIASHAIVDYTFATQYDFTNNQVNVDVPYTISVWIDVVEGDRVRFNDTLNFNILSYGKAPMPLVSSPKHISYHESDTITATDISGIANTVQFWYTNAGYESWNLQYVGNPFTTPLIYFDTMFYVASAPGQAQSYPVGTVNTSVAANNITQPFVFTNGFSRGKILYKASEGFADATGKLSKIELYVTTAATGIHGIPIRLYAMNTDLTSLSAAPVNTWYNDIANATLIYDGSYFFNTTGWVSFSLPEPMEYTGGNLLILTETYCGNQNCEIASGTTGYPVFNASSVSNCVLYKGANGSESNFSGNYSTYGKRLNMKFQFVDAGCQSEKVPIQVIADNVPVYDVEPVELVDPLTNQCTLLDTNIRVKVRNLINNTIPANTVQVVATFYTNTVSRTVTQLVDETFEPNEEKIVRFSTPIDLSAPTADVSYNYTIVTDLIGTPAFRGNDTLRGILVSKKTATMPEEVIVEGEYLHDYTVYRTDLNSTVKNWTFWTTPGSSQPSTTNNNTTPVLTTPVLYDTVIYYIQGYLAPCSTRVTKYQINVATPLYDISTDNLVSPLSYQCGISSTHFKVNVTNTWPTSNTIPANTFKLKADFTSPTTPVSPIEHTISQPITSGAPRTVTFGNAITLGSSTVNNIYNYTIYSNPVDPNMYVYRQNDTIQGTLYVPATPAVPGDMTASAPYGGTATITPSGVNNSYYYFYDQPTGGVALAQGTSFTTPPIISDPTEFYYSVRIVDPQFDAETTVGAGNVSNNVKPFDFSKEHSVGIIMYTNEELGFREGIIDTLFLYIHSTGSGNIPIKLYLRNDSSFVTNNNPTLTPALMNTLYQNTWNNIVNGSQIIVDDNISFEQTGWYPIVIPGGFHYTGKSLLLLTEHQGKNTVLGYTGPVIRSTTVSSSTKRVLQYANDNFNPAEPTPSNFTQTPVRFNTKFSIGYTCESAGRGNITVHTVLPGADLELAAIISPETPNNAYTNTEAVTVQLKNHGSNNVSDYSISYQLEGQAPVTVTNPVTVPNTHALVEYTFATPIDLSVLYFPQTFKVYVSCTADNNQDNDTITIVLRKDLCESGSLNAVSPCIANVTFAGINNVPLPEGWSPFGSADTVSYTDYTRSVAPAVLVKGQTYAFSVTNAFVGNGVKLYKYAFIDYNRNGSFDISTSADNERVFNKPNISAPNNAHPERATTEDVITVPETASEGMTLLRVVSATNNTSTNNSPSIGCGYFDQGETEDYAVIIRGAFNHDLAVVGYMQPSGVSCPDAAANIKVYVKNCGLYTQTFTATNPLELTAVVSGTTPGTYTQIYAYGSIAAGATEVYTIPNVNLLDAGDYMVVTTLAYNNDEYEVNNSWKTSFSIGNLTVDTVPVLQTFDEEIIDPENPFGDFWTFASNNTNYSWTKRQGPSSNVPDAGPEGDHTTTNMVDQYALVAGKNSYTGSYYATMTTNCLDLHYCNGYPIQLDFWEHIFGTNTNTTQNPQYDPAGTLLIQVATGDNFVTIDSVVGPTQTSSEALWKNKIIMLRDNDEVAKVRFRTLNHRRMMDIAVDDVNFDFGKPDIAVDKTRGYLGVFSPTDFRDSINSCMVYGDSVHPKVAIINSGLTPVDAFDIKGTWKVGIEVTEYIEHWEAEVVNGVVRSFMPGDTMTYTFNNVYVVNHTAAYSDFGVELMLAWDNNPNNDKTAVHPCASIGIDDYAKEGGLVLQQNVPNPAETRTRISFIVPRDGQASIEVFSVTGQKLYSESVNAHFGENHIDLQTSAFAAGMYIYTLQFGDAVLSKKMIIQK